MQKTKNKKFWCHLYPFANLWFVPPYLINEGDIRELVIYHYQSEDITENSKYFLILKVGWHLNTCVI
jgi:hypothetical protein